MFTHFYVDLSICLCIYMYLFVDNAAFVCGSLHICARIYETPHANSTRKCVFFNIDPSLANQMSPSLLTNHMSVIHFVPALEGRGLSP